MIQRLRSGDRQALHQLVDRYEQRIYGFAARMCRSRDDARDVLQETFLAAVRAARSFRGGSRLSTWLFRIAANACLKMRRKGKFEPERHLSLDELRPGDQAAVADEARTPEAEFLRGDLRERLERGIVKLPPAYRAVLILRDLEGLSAEETARALGLGVPAVKSRLHRARLFLRLFLLDRAPGSIDRSTPSRISRAEAATPLVTRAP